MTTLASDTFTGSNGAALSATWTTGYTGTGASTAIQGNKGRWTTGTAGGYAGGARISRRVVITSPDDVEVSGTYTPNGESYPEIYVRAPDTTFDTQGGYAMRLPTQGGSGNLSIIEYVAYSGTTLGTAAFSATTGTTYGFRFQAIGDQLKGRIWNTSGAEPGTWNLEITDSTITAAGNVGISVGAGNAASTYVDFDDVVVTDGEAPPTPISLADTGAGAEALAVAAAVPLADVGSGAEALAVLAAVPLADTGEATDALLVEIGLSLGDTGASAEALTVAVHQLRHDLLTEIELTPGVWTDVSTYVVAESESAGTFGRPTRYDDVGPSTWATALRNSDGAFTPPTLTKGMQLRTSLTYAGQDYPLFYGRITGITLPAVSDVANCVVHVQAADVMAALARKTLLSPFVEESRRQATIRGRGCDVFSFPPSQVATDTTSIAVAATSFENKGIVFTGGTRLGSMYAMPVTNGAGAVKSSARDAKDGALVEGQLTFEIGDDGSGKQAHPVLVAKPQTGFQQAEFFFKLPKDVLPPVYATGTHTVTSGQNWNTIKSTYGMTTAMCLELNPDAYPAALGIGQVLNIAANSHTSEWILAHFWAGSTEVFRIVLGNYRDTVAIAVKLPNNSAQFIYVAANLADERWRKLTIYRTGTNTVRFNINDAEFGTLATLGADLTAVDTVYLGGRVTPGQTGRQVQCPPVSLSGVAFQQAVAGVWYWYCLGAPPANLTAQDRLLELAAYADPVPLAVDASGDLSAKVVRTDTAGRSVLDCLQELARTVLGYLWTDPSTGTLLLVNPTSTTTPIATITLDEDDDGGSPPQWKDTIDAHPTRVTATCPAGQVTSINTTAEASGAYKEATITTCAATVAAAQAVSDRAVSTGAALNLTNLSVDLVTSQNALWGPLLAGLAPGALLRVEGIPAAVFGYDTADVQVETWSYSFTIDTATVTLETTPVRESNSSPPTGGTFVATGAEGSQSGSTITVLRPAGTALGDLLVAIMTCDNTGSVAALAPPDSTWTAQGAGGEGDSGFGQVWTKTAGASEPTSYAFTAGGTTGVSVLVSDNFTGTNGAAISAANWTAAETRTGATTTILDNTCALNPGTGTGYTGRVSILANTADKADVDLAVSFRFGDNDSFFWAMLRSNDDAEPDSNGYEIRPQVGSAGCRIASVSDFTTTTLGTIAGTLAAGTWYRLRFQTIGTAVRARLWPAADPEPSSWGVDVVNSVWTTAGNVALVAGGGNTAAARIYLDDAIVSDPNASTSIPEAKLTLMRVTGADTSDPILVAPSWSDTPAATTSHEAPSLTIPDGGGLLVDRWHILTAGSGSGGGEGGSAAAFAFGMSGFDNASQIDAANAWLTNHSLEAVGFWADVSAAVQQEVWGLGPGETFGSYTGIVDLAVGGVFGSETWAQAAAGNFDSRWTTSLNTIRTKWGSRPPGNLFLRFAHEFNGDWSPWYVVPSDAANFRNAWIRWANLCRSILPGVQIAWSPNDGFSGGAATVENVWPGSAYVDVVAPDTYNAWPHATTKAEFDAKMLRVDGNGNPEGMERWRVWAEGKGKPLAMGEWGNRCVDVGDGGGGGDHPVYAQEMLAWCKTNGGFGAGQVRYAIYFSFGPDEGYPPDYEIWPNTRQPLTAAMIRDNA